MLLRSLLVAVIALAGSAGTARAQTRQTYTVRYSYDAAGRLVEAAYDDSSRVAYTFDAAGTLASVIVTANQAPLAFRRLLPPDSAHVRADTLRLGWSAAADPEGDPVVYLLHLTTARLDTTLTLADTALALPLAGLALPPEPLDVHWSVRASDGRRQTEPDNGAGYFVLEATTSTSAGAPPGLPGAYALDANYPNPFNPETRISYALPEPAAVRLVVYNVLGQRVRVLVDARQPAGRYDVRWDGRNEAGELAGSGLYVYRIEAGSFTRARTMVLLK